MHYATTLLGGALALFMVLAKVANTYATDTFDTRMNGEHATQF